MMRTRQARCRSSLGATCRELGSQIVEVTGLVFRRDGTTNVIATNQRAVQTGRDHAWLP